MNTLAAVRICQACTSPIHGRADKKFCDDHCRNAHNNQLKSPANNMVRTIYHKLLKNRRLLEMALPEQETIHKVVMKKLTSKGFSMDYYTNIYQTKKGHTYYYCFDYGYLVLDSEHMLIVRKTVV